MAVFRNDLGIRAGMLNFDRPYRKQLISTPKMPNYTEQEPERSRRLVTIGPVETPLQSTKEC